MTTSPFDARDQALGRTMDWTRKIAIGVGLLVLLAGTGWIWYDEQGLRTQREQALRTGATDLLHVLMERLEASRYAAHVLVPVLESTRPQAKQFDTVATALLHGMGPDIALEWAPEGVVRYISPLADRDSVLGLDLLNPLDPVEQKQAQDIVATGQPGWKGPFGLIEGGCQGLAYVIPEFTSDPAKHFRGFVQVVLRFPGIVDQLNPREHLGQAQPLVTSDPPTEGSFVKSDFAREATFAIWVGNDPESLHRVYGPEPPSAGAVWVEKVLPPYGYIHETANAASAPVGEVPGQLVVAIAIWRNQPDVATWVSRLALVILGALLVGSITGWLLRLAQVRRLTQQMQSEYEQMRQVLDQARTGFVIFDPQGNSRWFNKRLLEIIGLNANQFAGLNAWTHPLWIQLGLRAAGRRALQGEAVAPIKVQGKGTFDQKLDLEVHLGRVQLTGVWHLVVQADDLTQYHAQQQALMEIEGRNQQLLAILDQTPDFVGMAALDQTVLYVNRGGRRLLGLPEQGDLPWTSISQFHPPWVLEKLAQQWPTLNKQSFMRSELALQHSDGHEVPVETILFALDGGSSTDGCLAAIMRDVSAEKAQRAELEWAKEQAEAASRAKSQFLATMSHELRTPLNGVLGMAQMLLQDGGDAAERREWARVILNAGRSLLVLLNDVLDLSKVEAGRVSLERIPFTPDSFLNEVGVLFQNMAQEKGLKLTWAWQGESAASYFGDVHRLRQMLSNLVGNALKFTETGQVTVTARQVALMAGHAQVEFAVRDTGIGIAAADLPHLFQTFSQADSSITRKYGGTGLGLAIVARLAEAMGGEAGVESTLGQGSRFWFRIALDLSEIERPHILRDNELRASQRLSFKGQVLVAEDNENNSQVVQSFLQHFGLQATVRHDGQEALAALQRGCNPDLILMDLHMPHMDGFEATQRIREWEEEQGRAPCPILALTADLRAVVKERCRAVGMDGFLEKPLHLEDLQAALQRWLPSDEPEESMTHPAVEVDEARLRAGVAALLPLLEGRRFNALEQLQRLANDMQGTVLAADFLVALENMRKLRFNEVARQLRELVEPLN